MKVILPCMTLVLLMLMCALMLLSLLYTVQKTSVEWIPLEDFYPLNYKVSHGRHHNCQKNVAQLKQSLTKIDNKTFQKIQ
jgi:hypothetical protein